MDERYDAYCAADPLFYDSLATTGAATAEFAVAARAVPDGWQREPKDDWYVYGPVGGALPTQGWKIHLSATLDNADRVLAGVWDYCVPRGLSFKFLRGPRLLLLRNAKYAPRGSSGKFVTIYPRDPDELELACKELDERLAGEAGPYILSDLRYGTGPVFVRYGGFAARYCLSPHGQVVPAIADPSGTLVPDRRDPVLHLPDWVTLPDFLAPHLAARNATSTTDLPYRIERVIHFSNGGGLYVGRDLRNDTQVVLKEARPYAGLDATGADAVTRLAREGDMLRRLADVPRLPRVHDEFGLGEHRFLALEFVVGQPLNRVLVERYPLIDADADTDRLGAYATWALEVYRQVEATIEAIHERGVVYGDLHLFNIMIDPDDLVTLVDFEVAAPVTETGRPGLRNQGFAAPRERTGFALDRYALACLRLALFLPLTQLVRLAPVKARHFADIIAAHFPVPRSFLDEAVEEITGGRETADTGPLEFPTGLADWQGSRTRLAGAILSSATPDRTDRLFPGDIEQFRAGGLNLAHGAAGVLYALAAGDAGRFPEHEDWLVERALDPPSGSRCGFYDGLHGVAYVLEHLGHRQRALDVLDICLREPWTRLGHDLAGGLSGMALNLAELAHRTGEPGLWEAAWRAADLVTDRVREADDTGSRTSGGQHPYAGLTRGRSGPALMFLRLHEVSGDPALLDLAATALRQDLRRCVVRADGAMEVDEGWRTMPYLAHGSVGIGLVLDQYLRHRPDEQFTEAALAIRRAARSPLYVQSGLFAGRAGIIVYLAARIATAGSSRPGAPVPDGSDEDRRELDGQLRRLSWHAMPYRDGVAFPGEQLLRLSMDLATGSAGVLLAITSARSDRPVTLPFLTPWAPAARRSPGDPTRDSLAPARVDNRSNE
ncbi:class III lanthionine synthetase LanKC [Micromonospora sp. NPDC004704]